MILRGRKIILLLIPTLILACYSSAQILKDAQAEAIFTDATLIRVNEITGKLSYVQLKETSQIAEHQLFTFLSKHLKLQDDYSFNLLKKEHDDLGFDHYRYQLTYNKIPILGAIIIAHFKNNRLHSFNGEVFEVTESNSQNILSENTCLSMSLDLINAKVYKWQLAEEEAILKLIKNNPEATWYPKGELMYCPKDLNFEPPHFYLTYKFTIHANEPLMGENIYCSVSDGKIIARENLIHTTDVPGSAITKYSGTKAIITDSTAKFNYRLIENTRGNGIYTLNLKKGTNYGTAVDFTDSNNIWNNINANKDEIATDAHWGAEITYDYFKKIHNRNSYNNNNARIYSYVHYSTNYDNAFWNGVAMTYGDGNTFKPLTSVDVCGHEVTHAVTSTSAGLIYSNESGALNESFSDVFGNSIERYGRPTQYNWKIGEDITTGGTGLRDMLNPKLKNHPRCYKSTNWYSGTGDNGGVHTNSGVQNWWYYLITEGGQGTNDVANTYKVDSLGMLKSEKIAFRNLTVYLTPSSNYADARFYSIQSAVDLFGNCGKEVIAVTNAWYACNVGPKYDSGFVKANFMADTIICNPAKAVQFTNLSANAISVKWNFGDGNSSTTLNPSHSYSNYGNYTIKLVAKSCFKTKFDSLTKVAYIKIDSSFDLCNSVLMPLIGKDSTSKCFSFVYDDGGEGIYKQQNTTVLKINVPGADSIVLKFLDFDYENKFDSLYLYRGPYPGGVKIGGYTGNTLPFAGKNFKVMGSMLTLRHFSDPLVTGRGFKMFYKAYKQPIDLTAFKDTTICIGNSVILHGEGTGGYFKDYVYTWQNISSNDSITVAPITTTAYKAFLTDRCTKSVDSAQVLVSVRAPLKVNLNKDTLICIGQSVTLNAMANGGQNTSYQYTWDNGLSNSKSHIISPNTSTQYRVILSDGCTLLNDTAYVNINVRSALSVKLNTNDTLICFNKLANLSTTGSGGLIINHVYTWNMGLGTGTTKSISLTNTNWLKVTLSDGCTSKSASDSVLIIVRKPLTVSLNNDTTLCMGTNVLLKASPNGGDNSKYTYSWTQGLPSTKTNSVSPSVLTKYVLTLSDNCSNQAKDSITLSVLPLLKLSNLKDTTLCYGGRANFKPIASGGKPLQYKFTWDNGLNNAKNQSVSPLSSTTYKLILEDNCSLLKDSALINVTVLPALKINTTFSKPEFCIGDSSFITLNFSGGIAANYKWFINGLPSFTPNFYLKPINSTNYKINFKDYCSNEDSSLFNLIVNPLPIVDFSSDKQLICRNDSVQFINSTLGASAYLWTFSPMNTSIALSPKFKYSKAGFFNVSLKATSPKGCLNTITKNNYIQVIELPSSDFSFLPIDPSLANPDVTFTNLSTNYSRFKWDFGDLFSDSLFVNPLHKYMDKGIYKVRLISFNSLGCSDTLYKNLTVEDIYYLWVPNAFSPNSDGINEELKIVHKGVASSEIRIFNRWGEKVYDSDLNGKPFDGRDKDGKTLQRGSYILEIKLRDFTKRYHIVRKVIEIL